MIPLSYQSPVTRTSVNRVGVLSMLFGLIGLAAATSIAFEGASLFYSKWGMRLAILAMFTCPLAIIFGIAGMFRDGRPAHAGFWGVLIGVSIMIIPIAMGFRD